MKEHELIAALQELVAARAQALDAERLRAELISRDRWRIRLLAGVTALLWLGGIAGVLYMIFWFNRFIIGYAPAPPTETYPSGVKEMLLRDNFHAKMELHHSLEACLAAVPALLLAALGTIWLVLSSRRATLNQINISLGLISEQLRQMRSPARTEDG
jgi:hypothetical protein